MNLNEEKEEKEGTETVAETTPDTTSDGDEKTGDKPADDDKPDDDKPSDDFDSQSFISSDSLLGGDKKEGEDEEEDDKPDVDADADEEGDKPVDEADIWGIDPDEDFSGEKKDADKPADEKKPEDDEKPTGEEDSVNDVLSRFKEIGVEAKDIDSLVKNVEGVLQEKEIYQKNKYTNKNIEAWKKALNLDNRELVKKNFLIQGASEKEAEKMTVAIETNDMLDNKGHDIRVAVRGSIQREQNAIQQTEASDVAKQQESAQRAEKQLRDHLDKTETMFGFRIGKEEDFKKIRDGHFNYIQSGKFYDEVTASAESMNDAAWFQRNKKQIIKALMNKGVQAGKEELLNHINNPSVDGGGRIDSPDGDTEFNANKFISNS